ncbi:MAG: alpha/beta hydrolase [Thermodesulfobacteriota bacterium]|nr:alpha/beta hydrolase [Thermodesulfobacteriota bacterium]
MPFVTIKGNRLAYDLKQGGAESFVFVHGLGCVRDSFTPCFEMAAFRRHTVAALDLPGCGESKGSQGFSYTMRDQADLVLQWISHLSLGQIILVGHSMGGVICQYVAEALGTKAKAFFNLEGNLGPNDCTFSARVAAQTKQAFEARGFERFKQELKEATAEDASRGLCRYYQNVVKADPRSYYLSSVSLVKESSEGSLRERFAGLSMDKWYVFGERSVDLATRGFLEAHAIPYFMVPESGHFMMDDQPALFYDMLVEALEKGK